MSNKSDQRKFLYDLYRETFADPPADWPGRQEHTDEILALITQALGKLDTGDDCSELITRLEQLRCKHRNRLATVRRDIKENELQRHRKYTELFNPFTVVMELHDLANHAKSMMHDTVNRVINKLRPDVLIGRNYRRSQTEKSTKATAARYGDRADIDGIIQSLAMKTDALGDLLPASELWPEFYNRLEDEGFNPDDRNDPDITDTSRITWTGNKQGMTFKTFRNNVSAARKPHKI